MGKRKAEKVELVAVTYQVLPADRDALQEEAARRAREGRLAANAERMAAEIEGRKPYYPLPSKEDASEVLRELLAAWRMGRK